MNKFFEHTKKAANAARQASITNLNAASTALSNASGTNIKFTTAKTDDELKRLLLKEPILFSGSAWKRRGGFAKLGSYTSAWESRHLQLRGKVLLYFDSDPTKALSSSNDPQELLRGYIDLAEEKATIQASFGHSGAPSPFCLSIKVAVGLAQETKWKLCFDHHHTQMEWLTAISDVVIQCSVDMYNRALLDAANPSHHGGTGGSMDSSSHNFLRRPPVYEPGTRELTHHGNGTTLAKPRSNSFQIVDCPHQLWMMDDYSVERKTTLHKEQQDKTKASVDTALQVMERLLSEERNQRAVASQKVSALGIELDEVRKSKQQRDEELSKLQTEKKDLESELSVRMSTHDVGDGPVQAIHNNTQLRAQVESLTKELEELKKGSEDNGNIHKYNDGYEDEYDHDDEDKQRLEQQVAELQTKLVIAQSESEEAMQKAKEESQRQQTEELEAVKTSMSQRIAELEKELEVNKKEYQESIQALAQSFQQSIGASESAVGRGGGGGGAAAVVMTNKNGDHSSISNGTAWPEIHRTQSEESTENDDFKDCVES